MSKLFKQKTHPEDAPRRRQRLNVDDAGTTASYNGNYRSTFHRNRTITGSSSGKVASTNELNAQMQSPRASAHHLARARRRLLLYFGGVLVVAGTLYLLVNQLVATETVQLSGGSALTATQAESYTQAAEDYFAARPIERFRFMINNDDFLRNMQATNPEVKAVHIDGGSSFGEAVLTITPREPIARWNTGNQHQFVDGNGIVFTRNYFAEPKVEIRDNSGIQSTGSQVVTSRRFLGFVGRVIGETNDRGYTVKTATIPALTTRQVRITLVGQQPYFTFSVDRPPAEQVEDMSRILRYLRTRGISARYVDVRVEGKAFYR